jgi:hypothetical protein
MLNVEDISFDEYLEMKEKPGREAQEYPGITVGPPRWNSIYLNKKAVELLDLTEDDRWLIAAPNPEAKDEFFLCKTDPREGYAIYLNTGQVGATSTRSLVTNCGDQFDAELHYKLEKTGMTHPEWGSEIYLASPIQEAEAA